MRSASLTPVSWKMAASVCRAGSSAAGRVLFAARSPALLRLKRNQSAVSYAQTLSNIPETQVTTLDNGLRVASEESSQPTCTVGVWIAAGSRYENEKNNGSAYFLEHLAFKGTKKRPQAALEQEVESMGAHLSTYTSREQTAIFIKALSKDLPKAVEILADVVQNNSLENSQIEKTREVVLRELQEVDFNLQEVVFDYLHSTAYQGTPLGNTVVGPSENAKKLTRADLLEYINLHYKAPRMVLAAAGGIDHKELCDLAQRHLGGLSGEYEDDVIPVLAPCRFTGSSLGARNDDLPLAHVAIAVEGPSWNSNDNVALSLANTIIGNYDATFGGGKNLSSNVARAAAEYNLCQSFQAFNIRYSDTGLLGMHFVSDKHNIEDTLHIAQAEWMRLCTSSTDSELAQAKKTLKSALVAQLDGTTPVCEDIGRQILAYGQRISLEEWNSRIDAVTAKTLREVCSKYLYDKCPAVAAVGPIEQLPDYNRIRSAMYWLRF
ncbi:cytochrome b-c1 complex subunit 1, mitochondrial [Pseudophryne corroboree]|uniref:cytochrome b-c1 complex subunit 1, mitochondrial n=1 Tax=Pseudophryne corroboree TaxID=495146 RepID=UPI0030814122